MESSKDLFPWSEAYSVHIARIDEQHKKLLSVVNDLHQGLVHGHSRQDLQLAFAAVLDYVLVHFETEEGLMEAYNYPGLEEHRREHDEFSAKLARFLDAFLDAHVDVASDMVLFLVGWIKTHVFLTDMKYSAFLNERGVH